MYKDSATRPRQEYLNFLLRGQANTNGLTVEEILEDYDIACDGDDRYPYLSELEKPKKK